MKPVRHRAPTGPTLAERMVVTIVTMLGVAYAFTEGLRLEPWPWLVPILDAVPGLSLVVAGSFCLFVVRSCRCER